MKAERAEGIARVVEGKIITPIYIVNRLIK